MHAPRVFLRMLNHCKPRFFSDLSTSLDLTRKALLGGCQHDCPIRNVLLHLSSGMSTQLHTMKIPTKRLFESGRQIRRTITPSPVAGMPGTGLACRQLAQLPNLVPRSDSPPGAADKIRECGGASCWRKPFLHCPTPSVLLRIFARVTTLQRRVPPRRAPPRRAP